MRNARGLFGVAALACTGLLGGVAVAGGAEVEAPAPAVPELLSATRLGTAGGDTLEGVAIADDGTIYVAGNTASPLGDLPDGIEPRVLGRSAEGWTYGCGLVARFSPDGRRLLGLLQFAPGAVKLTTVAVCRGGVYVGGYASPGLGPVVAPLGGLLPKPHGFAQRDLDTYCPGEHYSEPRRDPRNDQRGVPVVLRFSADLSRIEAGTFLEGWQSCWHVPWPLGEDHWQPVGLGVLAGGDVVVSHDGGYNRMPAPDEKAGFEHFYGVPDYVSRLSPDLARRRWRIEVYTPPVDPEKVNRYQNNFGRSRWRGTWTRDSLGNTRTLRLAVGPDDAVAISGWSPTRTSGEPWWSSFLWKLGPDGAVRWRAYNPDPMSGKGDRMGGQVSDACVRSVAFDARGHVLAALAGDGGNNILRWDPRDYTRPAPNLRGRVTSFHGRVLFWGGVVRLHRESQEVLGGNHIGGYARGEGRRGGFRAAWAKDIAPLPGGRVLAIGRNTRGFETTQDAWHRDTEGGFVRAYSPKFDLEFSTSLPDVDPATVAVRGSRAAMVGTARALPARHGRQRPPAAGDEESERLRTPVESPALPAPDDARDGYLMVLDFASPAR